MTQRKDLLSAVNSNVVKEHLDACDAGKRGQTLAGQRIVGGTDSVPGLHPWIGAIIKGKSLKLTACEYIYII